MKALATDLEAIVARWGEAGAAKVLAELRRIAEEGRDGKHKLCILTHGGRVSERETVERRKVR